MGKSTKIAALVGLKRATVLLAGNYHQFKLEALVFHPR